MVDSHPVRRRQRADRLTMPSMCHSALACVMLSPQAKNLVRGDRVYL